MSELTNKEKLYKAVNDYNIKNGWRICECDSKVIDSIFDDGSEVWRDPDVDKHRWYSIQYVVYELSGYYIMFPEYDVHGDGDLDDYGLTYDISDFIVVEKKTRIVEETYYE